MAWLNDHIWPFEAKQTKEDIALGMTLGMAEMLLGGITSFVDMYFEEDHCVEVVDRMGMRAVLGCSYFDATIDKTLSSAERAVKAAAGKERIRISVAPHAPYTVSDENLKRGKRFAEEHGLDYMVHAAETQDELKQVAERYGTTPCACSIASACWMSVPSWRTVSGSMRRRSRSCVSVALRWPTTRRAT